MNRLEMTDSIRSERKSTLYVPLLGELDTLGRFSAILYKGDNF